MYANNYNFLKALIVASKAAISTPAKIVAYDT